MTAETGKVRNVSVEDLRAGMKVQKDVMGRGDKVLMSAGEVATRKHVDQMNKWERRERPMGPALPRANPKDPRERVRHAEFQGGWRPSHFNPRGILVTNTLASGDEVPEVERDPTRSPAIQNIPQKSFNVPVDVESPLFRQRALETEIASLERTNAQLEGVLHLRPDVIAGEAELEARRDELVADNEGLIRSLKSSGNGEKSGQSRAKGGKARK